jgi:REP element-mobilizing transposase RayT
MIHAYHVIWGTYGFWLPNDPRGSWSDFVASWELLRFGKASQSIDRQDIPHEQWQSWRAAAQQELKFPPVTLTGLQARAAASGFASAVRKSRFCIWACSILPEHVHMVVARHRFGIEKICNLLKGEATKRLSADSLHPLARFTRGERPPSPWARGQWKVFLESEAAIEEAIRYVEENPVKEGKRRQRWSFVTPFAGLEKSGWITYH